MILAKLNGKELPDKPAMKWFKGKWLELDSKSGARFSFKESHDSASNVRTLWGLEGLWARAGDQIVWSCLVGVVPGRREECLGRGRVHLGTACACPESSQGQGRRPPEAKIVQAWEETAGPSWGPSEL